MKKIAPILPLFAGMSWGFSGVFVRTLTDYGMNNLTILYSKIAIASILLFFVILIFDKHLLLIKWKDLWLFAVCGIIGMLGLNVCYNAAILTLTMSLAAVLLCLAPVFVTVLSVFIFKEPVTLKKIGYMSLAIIGCSFVSGIFTSDVTWTVFGVFLGLLSAFFYALNSIFTKLILDRGYYSFTVVFYSMFLTTVILIPFADYSSIFSFAKQAPVAHSVFYLLHASCSSILPYILFAVGLKYVETGKASIIASGSEPTSAMIFGAVFFQEQPTFFSVFGLCLTVLALYLLLKPDTA